MTDNLPAHSHLGASSSERWMNCPGSIRLSRGLERASGIFAAEGTAAHWLADQCLRNGREPREFAGCEVPVDPYTFTIDDEMIEAVETYLEAIKSRVEPGDEVESEVKFHLKDLHPDLFGTADCAIYKPASRKLIVVDFKYGKGVPVAAEFNPQLMYYGYGAATRKSNRGVGEVDIVIVQPRCPLPGDEIPGVRTWSTDVVQLLDHSADLVEAARATEADDAPTKAGDWCKFCPAAAVCPTLKQYALAAIKADFSDDGGIILSELTTFSSEAIGEVLRHKEIIKDWMKRLEEYAHHEAEAGRPPKGWKLVPKRATRKWRDPFMARMVLETQWDLTPAELLTEPELRSPAQVEKLIPKKMRAGFNELYESVSSGTVLAPESDPRPAVTASLRPAIVRMQRMEVR